MSILNDEVPFTSEAVKVYIEEVEKEMDKLHDGYLKYNRLKTRLKLAKERLEKRGN